MEQKTQDDLSNDAKRLLQNLKVTLMQMKYLDKTTALDLIEKLNAVVEVEVPDEFFHGGATEDTLDDFIMSLSEKNAFIQVKTFFKGMGFKENYLNKSEFDENSSMFISQYMKDNSIKNVTTLKTGVSFAKYTKNIGKSEYIVFVGAVNKELGFFFGVNHGLGLKMSSLGFIFTNENMLDSFIEMNFEGEYSAFDLI